ncbi:MAG: hypothetical protein NZ766_04670, partial [SAR86 cluster bacterium]|nr:hypothetical protein [SAR86 cluster bacterium]
ILKMFKKKGVLFLREEYGEGFGKYTYLDGEKFVGEWIDDKEWNGNEYNKDGKIISKYVNGNYRKP